MTTRLEFKKKKYLYFKTKYIGTEITSEQNVASRLQQQGALLENENFVMKVSRLCILCKPIFNF